MDDQDMIDMNAGINERPDIDPVNIPAQSGAPSVTDRISRIEDILHLNS